MFLWCSVSKVISYYSVFEITTVYISFLQDCVKSHTIFTLFIFTIRPIISKEATLKHSLFNLGVLLITIILALAIFSLGLIFSHEKSTFLGLGMGIIFIVMMITFVTYMILDLYRESSINNRKLLEEVD